MRFQEIKISNFRAIREFHARDLTDLVVIAGPNGCGKSCILDAIRLMKSVYGGYQTNEWLQWFGEFQVNLGDPNNYHAIFRDKAKPITIEATMQMAPSENAYLNAHAYQICEPIVWVDITRVPPEPFGHSSLAYAAQYPQLVSQVAATTTEWAKQLTSEIEKPGHNLSLSLAPDGTLSTAQSLLARAVFQTYDPEHLGILDFHSASRAYSREALGGINLDVKAIETQRRTQRLYNWQAKYQNIKSELATMYFQSLVSKAAGGATNASAALDDTLKELFRTFFPDKEYLGVQPTADGTISFPVQLSSGEIHDINDLSSGEKEVVYGYLRLRSSTPGNSIVLLDEPELHLNPGLLQGFPDFYYRHLSKPQNNQLWLVTHSDTLLRQAVGNPNFSVYHMISAPSVVEGANQAVIVSEDELQAALLDLVGDLAAYRPTGKVLIFEGGGDSEFDVGLVRRLFPALASRCNLISGGSKRRVHDLYAALQRTAEQTGLADRFYAITDRDSDVSADERPTGHVLSWDVYHIENYLLDPLYVYRAYKAVVSTPALDDVQDTLAALRQVAERSVDQLVLNRLEDQVRQALRASISIGADPNDTGSATALLPSITATLGRLEELKGTIGLASTLESWAAEYRESLNRTLTDHTWLAQLPGRIILKGFVHEYLHATVSYEAFVNLIVNQMVMDEHQPVGMRAVLKQVAPF